jgi:hypothetical protein
MLEYLLAGLPASGATSLSAGLTSATSLVALALVLLLVLAELVLRVQHFPALLAFKILLLLLLFLVLHF